MLPQLYRAADELFKELKDMLRIISVPLIVFMFIFSCSLLSWAESGSTERAIDEEGYIIGTGDALDISVWKDESLTRTCIVRPDGFISFPLLGSLKAAGKTAPQLKSEMEKGLSRYMTDVLLFLDIREIRSLTVYVIGKVNNPGRFILSTNINVLQALATAGGLNVFARKNDIKIFRQERDKTTILPFEYDKVVEGKRLEQNIYLERGDVVVIP
jgi:polysaccharide export outer membrane protein